MTFKEYLNRKGKSRIPLFSVEIKVKDCEYILVSKIVFAGKEVKAIEFGIDVNGIHCEYKCYANSRNCYTLDGNGNMVNPTVFIFVDKI